MDDELGRHMLSDANTDAVEKKFSLRDIQTVVEQRLRKSGLMLQIILLQAW